MKYSERKISQCFFPFRIYERNKQSELQLYEKLLDEINNLNMEILETMIENENTEEEIEQ